MVTPVCVAFHSEFLLSSPQIKIWFFSRLEYIGMMTNHAHMRFRMWSVMLNV